MVKVSNFLLFLVFLIVFISPETNANSATCILLKQQMSTYQNSKTHPTYRRAHRDYERFCNQPEPTKTVDKTTAESNPQKSSPISEPTLSEQEKQLAQQKFEEIEADLKAKQQAEAAANEAQKIEQNPTQPSEQSETKPAASEVATVTPKEQPKPSPVQWQNQAAEEQTTLLDAMMLPIIMLLVVLVAIFIYVKFVRARMDEIKEKAQEMSKEIVAAGKKAAEKKKAKPAKGSLDPDLYFRRTRIEVSLPNGKDVMLDSIIASQFGIFVVLGQKQRGAIIGSATLPDWKEQVGEELVSFESPLNLVNQCCHAVSQIIELSSEIEPIVAFNDMAVFKSQLPIAVMHKKKVNTYILGFKELKYSDDQVDEWLAKIDDYIAARAEQKRLAEEQERQQNLNRHNNSEQLAASPMPPPSELNTAEPSQEAEKTSYPEPGSYQDSVSEIAPDNQDVHRAEELEKPVVDHIAELDAILNKAKEFTEKLDNISSTSSSTSDELDNEQPVESSDFSAQTKLDSEFEKLQALTSSQLDETPNSAINQTSEGIPESSENIADGLEQMSHTDNPQSFDNPNIQQHSQQVDEGFAESNLGSSDDFDNYLSTMQDLDAANLEDDIQATARDSSTDNEQNNSDEENKESDSSFSEREFQSFEQDEAPVENMVPHSEFKRRAAKRAVDEGMFDYLEHYNDKAADSAQSNDTETSLEDELAKSLEAGKGFLTGLDEAGKVDAPDNNYTLASSGEENNNEPDINLSAEQDIDLTTFSQDERLDEFTASASEPNETDDDKNRGGWRAIKAQMDETENSQPSDENQEDNTPKSSWRALKEQVDSLEQELPEEDDNEKNEASTKPSIFSNLELDPDWAPKPPPEKVFKVRPEDDPDNN